MAALEVKQISKSFKETKVLKDISFSMEKGEVVAIIGSSGSGKTTLLRCLNFLETPDNGQILVNDQILYDAADLATKSEAEIRRNRLHFGLVFQSFNLFPQYTAKENVMLAKQLLSKSLPDYKKRKKEILKEIEGKAEQILTKVGLQDKINNYPHQLSGGQQQRVAIARALVKMPRVLLLDEPLSNLDARLRLQTREEIRRIQKETKITTIFVTHDQEEAMSISDRIVVMKDGVLHQIGKPQEVYDDPVNLFVAKFLGTPPINVFEGYIKNSRLYIGDENIMAVDGVMDRAVYVGIRPEGFILQENGPMTCQLDRVEVMGRDISVISRNNASLNEVIRSIIPTDHKVDITKESINFAVVPHKVFLFNKETEERIHF